MSKLVSKKLITVSAVLVCTVGAASAHAQSPADPAVDEPSVEAVQQAGDEFNLGRTAFKDEDFATAAEHFEKADRLAPNPKVLLLAIQARKLAGHGSRAATLAALAQDRYPQENMFTDTRSLIMDALDDQAKLKVTCDRPCNVLIDGRLVHGKAATKRFVFLEPGSYGVRAAWEEGGSHTESFAAQAGKAGSMHFTSPQSEGPSAPPPDDEDDIDWGVSEPTPAPPSAEPPATIADTAAPTERNGLSPTVFWIGAGVTALSAGVSIWSGVDAQNNPGPDRVRSECAGRDTSCPAYQEGKSAELRTNVLWGVTGGLGLATILIGSLWTDWGGPVVPEAVVVSKPSGPRVSPWFNVADGAMLGAQGRF
jgi:hypothetical protein